MDVYYNQQSQMPHFSGSRRQRGSGIGALALGIGRFAIPFGRNVAAPFIRKVAVPAAKRIGKELLQEGLPELIDVLSKRQTPKQALKQTVIKTVRKQVGAGRVKKRRQRKQRRIISKPKLSKRSRADFFSKLKQ